MAAIIDKLKGKSQIKEGDKITSSHALKESGPTPEDATLLISQLKGKNLLVGVPGAFTGPCSKQLPLYQEYADSFVNKGVKGIYVVPVNDHFATAAWKEKLGASHEILHFAADDTGNFTRDIGLSFDATGLLGGERAKRYVAVLEDNTVKKVLVEPDPTQITVTAAEAVLQEI